MFEKLTQSLPGKKTYTRIFGESIQHKPQTHFMLNYPNCRKSYLSKINSPMTELINVNALISLIDKLAIDSSCNVKNVANNLLFYKIHEYKSRKITCL